MTSSPRIAVVIPCFKVRKHILSVIGKIGPEVTAIYAVDDACPEQSGRFIQDHCTDKRVQVIFHRVNCGVGKTFLTGMHKALEDRISIIVKIDGDGQMDPALIPQFVFPIWSGIADYTKGNRFYSLRSMSKIPRLRKIGNLFLSFMTKLSSGYYHIFDPTNGYLAIQADVARLLEERRIAPRYFFESDMLFNLSLLGASICDIPMEAHYGDEESSLNVLRAIPEFFFKNTRNAFKRICYNYFLRDFNPASLALILGLLFMGSGLAFGSFHWLLSIRTQIPASAGTVMLAAFQLFLGLTCLSSFFNYDLAPRHKIPLHKRLLQDGANPFTGRSHA